METGLNKEIKISPEEAGPLLGWGTRFQISGGFGILFDSSPGDGIAVTGEGCPERENFVFDGPLTPLNIGKQAVALETPRIKVARIPAGLATLTAPVARLTRPA